MSHHELTAYTCTRCDKGFLSQSSLTWHLKKHIPEAALNCEHCEKIFYSTTALKNHVLLHKDEKPHTCSECPESFRQKVSLTQHMRKHSGVLPFPCNYCQEAGFTYKKALRKHWAKQHSDQYLKTRKFLCELCWEHFYSDHELALHTAAKHDRHKCQVCGRQFKMRVHLTEHLLRHARIKPFGCKECPDLNFLRRKGLVDHVREFHPGKDMTLFEEVTEVDFM